MSIPPADPLQLPIVRVHELREVSPAEFLDAVKTLKLNFPRGMPAWGSVRREGWDTVVAHVPTMGVSHEFVVMGCRRNAPYALVRNVVVDIPSLLADADVYSTALELVGDDVGAEHVLGRICQAAVDTFYTAAEERYAEQSMRLPADIARMEPA